MSDLRLIEPHSAAEMEAFRALNWAYRDFLLSQPPPNNEAVTAAYPEATYRAILDAAETDNRPPKGQMRLMLLGEAPVGCGSVQTLGPGDAEIKRVYIRPEAQGRGAGRQMMEQLIADCRALGARRILMDTGRVLEPAWRLYDRMGFQRRGPYLDRQRELADLLYFFEMPLD
ncbi:GNAT family N-acetyltransferase [Rhodobacterales bacterium HKCCE4037]|nr:GNAT family N-acetyltransferase [Rhodobacterales bacterium HKCCE4037]